MITGVKTALQNPPHPGETWIQITDGDEVLWKSDKFEGLPLPKEKKNKQFFEISLKKITVPSQYERWRNWHNIYYDNEIQEIYIGEGEFAEIKRAEKWKRISELVGKRYGEPVKVETLKDLFYAGDQGFLVDYKKDMEILNRNKPE